MSFSWLFLGGVVSTRARLRFTSRGQCAVNSLRWSRLFQRTAKYLLTGCPTPAGKRRHPSCANMQIGSLTSISSDLSLSLELMRGSSMYISRKTLTGQQAKCNGTIS
jgi:hypothetical protein